MNRLISPDISGDIFVSSERLHKCQRALDSERETDIFEWIYDTPEKMSRMIRNERGGKQSSLFSFAAPVSVAVIVLVVLIKAIFSLGNGSGETNRNANLGVKIIPGDANSEVYIYMSGDSKKKIEGEEWLLPTDNRLEVKNGDALVLVESSSGKIFAERGAEISYKGKDAASVSQFELQNSYLWVESDKGDFSFKLKSFTAVPKAGSVVAFSQNTVGSNVYVLKGSVDVSTETSNTNVGVNQMLTVITSEAKNLNLLESIRPIESFFRTENVYVKHDGDKYLLGGASGESMINPGETESLSGSKTLPSMKPIVLTSPEDEASFEKAEADFEGKIQNSTVTKVVIGEKEARVDLEAKTFAFKGFPLSSNSNDIVYKAFDKEGNLVYKDVVTVYSSAKKKTTDVSKPSVTTFPISDKEFRIVAPSENPFKTTENVVRIEGRLPKGVAKYVTVNDFRLSKFSQFGTSWYYFANKDYGTMNDGINTYEIKYYGEDDKLLKTSQFIIVKEQLEVASPVQTVPAITPEKTSSGSATDKIEKPL